MSESIVELLKEGSYAERKEAYRLLGTLEHDDPKQHADLAVNAKAYGFTSIDEYIASLTLNDIITGIDPSRSRQKAREKILDIVYTHAGVRELDKRTNTTSFKTKTISQKVTPQFIMHICGRILITSLLVIALITCFAYIAMDRSFQNLEFLPVLVTIFATLFIVSIVITISEVNRRRLTNALRNAGILESEINKHLNLDFLTCKRN